MTHHLWLIINNSSIMAHNLWLIINNPVFYKKSKKIDDALESQDSNFVMWCNGEGLADLIALSQKHARKCNETCIPLLNGFKVSDYS